MGDNRVPPLVARAKRLCDLTETMVKRFSPAECEALAEANEHHTMAQALHAVNLGIIKMLELDWLSPENAGVFLGVMEEFIHEQNGSPQSQKRSGV